MAQSAAWAAVGPAAHRLEVAGPGKEQRVVPVTLKEVVAQRRGRRRRNPKLVRVDVHVHLGREGRVVDCMPVYPERTHLHLQRPHDSSVTESRFYAGSEHVWMPRRHATSLRQRTCDH